MTTKVAIELVVLILTTFFLFFVVDKILGEIIYHYSYIDNDNFVAIQRINKFNDSKSKNKIIILGSSMSREGVDEKYLADQIVGSEIYNFSISSGKPSDFFLIASQLNGVKTARLAIICISPWMFQKNYTDSILNKNDPVTNLFFNPQAILKIIPLRWQDSSWFLGRSVYSFFNVLKYNDYLKQILDHSNLSFWKTKDELTLPAIWNQYGYTKNYSEDYFAAAIKDSTIKSRFGGDYYWNSDDSVQMRALAAVTSQLREQGVKILVIDMPVNPYIKKLYDKNTEADFAAAMATMIPRQDFYEEAFLYGKSKFIDFDHLNYKGRTLFSINLARKIAALHVF
ncbi:MAG: hypothetical protein WCX69_00665 [Candidatus Paceibacterota bacterium]